MKARKTTLKCRFVEKKKQFLTLKHAEMEKKITGIRELSGKGKRGFPLFRFGFCWILSCLFFPLQAQDLNGTQQLPNRGFEEYDNLGSSSVEPVGWNSFMTANSAGGLIDAGKAQRLDRVGGGRPGSNGSYHLRVYSTNVVGVNANGNVTTGRINMGSMTASDLSNHNFTDRSSAGFNLPFGMVPDSMVVWVRYAPDNASDRGQIRAIIHNDNDTRDPGTDYNQAVAVATVNPVRGNGDWIRYSVPFNREGCGSTEPRYCLVSISSNAIPGGGAAEIYVDDILFVYNPELRMNTLPVLSFNMRDGAQRFEIPFSLSGTMSPNTYPANPNEVIAEMSDAEGSFVSPLRLGSLRTDESGSVEATIPAGTPLGEHYRIRLRSTNYPLVTPDNGQDIVLMRGFTIAASVQDGGGTVSGAGAYAEGSEAVLTATPYTGYHFVRWEENGQEVAGAGETYVFRVDADRSLRAVFALNQYNLHLAIEGEGSLVPAPGDYAYQHASRVELRAEPSGNYQFSGFYSNGILLSANPEYAFDMVSDMDVTALFEPGRLRIMALSSSADLGSVSGSGLYEYGSEVVLTASPLPFCRFVAWLENGDTVGTETELRFVADTVRTLQALFDQQYYELSLEASPAHAGMLIGAGRFSAANVNTTIQIEAIPEAGWRFLYWVDGKDQSRIPDNPYTVLERGRLTEDRSFTAFFEEETYAVTLSSNVETGGELQGAGNYTYGQEAVLEAKETETYRFVAWTIQRSTEEGVDTLSFENPYAFTVEESAEIQAVFALVDHRIELSPENASYGRTRGGGIYAHFDTAVLEAVAMEGYEFRYWAGRQGIRKDSVSAENPWKLAVLEDASYVAVFSEARKQVSALAVPAAAGSVEGTGLYENASYALLRAQAAPNYHFAGWGDDLGIRNTAPEALRLYVLRDTTLHAYFEPDVFHVEVMTGGASGKGQVFVEGRAVATRLDLDTAYGVCLSLEAESLDPEVRFSAWRIYYTDQDGNPDDSLLSRQAEYLHVVTGPARIVAEFGTDLYGIEAVAVPGQAGKVENQGNYATGQWAALEAVPNPGFAFDSWADKDGNRLGQERVCHVPALQDTLVQAVFKPDTLELGLAARLDVAGEVRGWIPASSSNLQTYFGEVSGSLRHEYGSEVVLEAVPAYGYEFRGWYRAQDTSCLLCLESSRSYVFEVEEDLSLFALFVPALFEMSVEVEPAGAGAVDGGGLYPYLSEARLEAVPAEGYVFSGWRVPDGEGAWDTLSRPVLGWPVEAPASLRALFQAREVYMEARVSSGSGEIRWVENQEEEGDLESSLHGYRTYGTQARLQAEAGAHFVFDSWTDPEGNLLGQDEVLELQALSDTLVHAVFVPEKLALEAQAAHSRQGYVEATTFRPGYGARVGLEAVAMPGYVFSHWTSMADTTTVLSRSPVWQMEILENTSLYAFFRPAEHPLRVLPTPSGAGRAGLYTLEEVVGTQWSDTLAWGDFASLENGSEVLLHAEAAPGYQFTAWRQGQLVLGEEPWLSIPVSGDMEVEAVFEPEMYRIEVQAEPATFGEVRGNGMFAYGQEACVQALPGSRYVFKAWRSGGKWISEEADFCFDLCRDTVLTAVFTVDSAWVRLEAGLGGETEGAALYESGETATLTARAFEGYVFEAWCDAQGREVSVQNPLEWVVMEDTLLQARFAPCSYVASIRAGEGGSASGSGEYEAGSTVVFSAVANPGYRFAYWQDEAGQAVYPLASLPVLMDADIALEAVFEPLMFQVNTLASPLRSGTVTSGGAFASGSILGFEAVADANHEFVAWTKDGEVVSTSASLQATVEAGDAGYVALFRPKRYNILTDLYPSEGGLAMGAGSYYWGDTAFIEVAVYPGYAFEFWSDMNFNTVSEQISFLHPVTGSDMFTASLTGGSANEDLPGMVAGDVSVRVYPNPVGPEGQVHFAASGAGIVRLRLFDLRGKQVFERPFLQSGEVAVQADVQALPSGVYLYQLEMSDGSILRGKLVRL